MHPGPTSHIQAPCTQLCDTNEQALQLGQKVGTPTPTPHWLLFQSRILAATPNQGWGRRVGGEGAFAQALRTHVPDNHPTSHLCLGVWRTACQQQGAG